MRADLHIHTTASDSRWTPEEVVAGVRANGIGLFAVTDHDTTAGVGDAEALARAANVAFLRGVEVSTRIVEHGKDEQLLHILGYGIDLHNDVLQDLLAKNRASQNASNDASIRDLIEMGYDIDYDDYVNFEYARTLGGWKSFNYLVARGFCNDERDFFANFWPKMSRQCPAFAHPADAVAAIRAAGGFPILAHPGASLKTGVTTENLEATLAYGIAGVECFSYAHDAATTALCVDWCTRRNLLITGGSDYHGGFVGRGLGIPYVDTAQLRLGELEAQIIR